MSWGHSRAGGCHGGQSPHRSAEPGWGWCCEGPAASPGVLSQRGPVRAAALILAPLRCPRVAKATQDTALGGAWSAHTGLPGRRCWGDQPGSLLRGSQAPFPGLGSAVVYQPQELPSQPGKARRAQHGAPRAPLKPGSQPLGPHSVPSNPWHRPFCCSQTLGDSPGGNTSVPWGWDLPGHPSREPTAAPAPPRAPARGPEQGSSPDLSHPPAAGRLLRGEGRNQQAMGRGVLFRFIQVPLKRSLYKSAHENAEGDVAGAARPLYIFTGDPPPPRKKGGDGNPGHVNNLTRHNTIRT